MNPTVDMTGKVFEELYDALLEHSDVPVVDKLAALTLVHGVLMGQHGIRLDSESMNGILNIGLERGKKLRDL